MPLECSSCGGKVELACQQCDQVFRGKVDGVRHWKETGHTYIERPTKERSAMDIPKDKNHPVDVGQCDDCGGHGCETCDQKGWLPMGHPKIRKCLRGECGNVLQPSWVPVYCSGQCALADA